LIAAQEPDAAVLRNLAEKLQGAYAQKDADALLSLWSEKSPQRTAQREQLRKLFGSPGALEISQIIIAEPEIDGDRARLRVSRQIAPATAPNAGTKIVIIECVREPAGWKVWKEGSAAEDLAARLIASTTEKDRSDLLSRNRDLVGQDLAQALIDRGNESRARGNWKEALRIQELVLAISEQAGATTVRAFALNAIAGVHFDQADFGEALEWDRRALQLSATLEDETPMAQALLNMGAVYSAEGEYSLAGDSFQKSLVLGEKLHNDQIVSNVVGNIAVLYGQRGDYVQALSYLKRSLELAERSGNQRLAAAVLINLGATFSRQGEYAQAEDHYRRALAQAESAGNKPLMAVSWMDLGQINEFEGDFTNALVKYDRSLAICNEIGDKPYIALVLTYIGNLHFARKEYAQAIDFFQKSLAIREAIGSQSSAGPTLTQLAAAHNLQGEFDEALRLSDRAREIAATGEQREVSWRAHLEAGNAYRGLKQLDRAEAEFAEAIATIDDLRTRVAGGESARENYFENKLEPYHRMVDLLVAQGRNLQALEFAERAKARALLDVLKFGQADLSGVMTAQELQSDRDLRVKLASLNAKLAREGRDPAGDPTQSASLHSALEKTRLQYAEHEAALYAAHPELKLQRGEVEPISQEDFLHILPVAQTAFVEFVVSSDKLYSFVSTSEGVKVFEQAVPRKQLAEQVERFRRQLANRDLGFRATAGRLYQLLLAPARAALKNKRELIIVPDDVLWEVPFQALLTPAERYLLDDYAISYAPSLTALKAMMEVKLERRHSTRKFQLLAMGNPVSPDKEFPGLPFAQAEVRRLGQIYGANQSRVYVGAEARESRLKAEAGDAKILHLATHAILDNASPLYSHLLLAVDPSDHQEDGFLEAWELLRMNLRAELVVLSACETARGRVGAGEGVIGLSWALFVSGVPTTVLSQWKVESASTSQLMIAFHENRKNGMDEAQAMRVASQNIRKDPAYAHPFYWAPFIVIGASR
jgi:CHAT domain-containing protein/tetratricopeptide (TPR) repeat protein